MKLEAYSEVSCATNSVLPEAAISLLPLKKEAISDWNENTDLISFLYELYEGTGYGDVSISYVNETLSQFEIWAEIFFDAASEAYPSPASIIEELDIPDFILDLDFGLLAKSSSVWNNTVANILAEGSYFSLPHLLETRTDLSSSIHLAAHLYYRQAYQVLRGFIESVVLPIYFCEYPKKYDDWKNNDYHAPPLRGDKGILKLLTNRNLIDESLATDVYDLYGLLNGYIHGSEQNMNNKGVTSGDWAGFVFQNSEFKKWVSIYSRCVFSGVKLLRKHHLQWEKIKSSDIEMCNICHGSSFTVNKVNKDINERKCDKCGGIMHQRITDSKQIIISTVEATVSP